MRITAGAHRGRLNPWALLVGILLGFLTTGAQAQEETVVSLKGRVVGGNKLLNPVWNEAKDPDNHRYTFRIPSTTVAQQAKRLTAYLPKELCIVALKAQGKAKPKSTPIQIHVSGGRTTPVTLVVSEGQNVAFKNHDPYPHKLFDVAGVNGGLGPEETASTKERVWLPPKAGVYEIRDKYFPSIRSWIVVEPRAAGAGFVNRRNEFIINDLPTGQYQLQAYFSGKAVGKPLTTWARTAPPLQVVADPLVLTPPQKSKDN